MEINNNTTWAIVLSILIMGLFQRCDINTSSKSQYEGAVTHVRIKAVIGLKYDVARFRVKPGTKVSVTLINTGEMEHNLVFTRPDKRKEIIKSAMALGAQGPVLHYVPSTTDVLWHISTLSPGDSQTISFKAPDEEGIYPYVCTYPGHGMTMYGAMYVTTKETLPPLEEDSNVPHKEEQNNASNTAKLLHPYNIEPPYLMRIFMPDCGPAAIAVSLSGSLSYCWDAGSCRLRYVWSGDFLLHGDLWQRKGMEVAHVAGTIFYKDKSQYPFRMGNKNHIPKVSFEGYRFKGHYPEFHYLWDGIDVYELIKPDLEGAGIVRSFRIPKLTVPLWYVNIDSGNARVRSSLGHWHENRLQLLPEEGRHFTIVITKK